LAPFLYVYIYITGIQVDSSYHGDSVITGIHSNPGKHSRTCKRDKPGNH